MSKKGVCFILAATACGILQQNRTSFAQPDPPAVPFHAANAGNGADAREQKLTNLRLQKADGTPLAAQRINIDFVSPHSSYGMGGLLTDAQGRVSVNNNFRVGQYSIFASAKGFGSGYFVDTNVGDGGAPPVTLQLKNGGTLRVIVHEAGILGATDTGRAIGGAEIALRLLPAGHTGINLPTRESTRDGDGVAELDDLAPGHYQVTVSSTLGYESATQELDVKGGETAEVNLSLLPAVFTALKVFIQDEQGQPIKDTDFSLSFNADELGGIAMDWGGARAMMSRKIHTDAKGEATLFPVKPGTWRVGAWGPHTIKATEVTIPREPGRITLVAQPQR